MIKRAHYFSDIYEVVCKVFSGLAFCGLALNMLWIMMKDGGASLMQALSTLVIFSGPVIFFCFILIPAILLAAFPVSLVIFGLTKIISRQRVTGA